MLNGCTSKSYLAILVFCLTSSIWINGQQLNPLGKLDTEDGLSQGMIFDVLQDRDGFIWFATKDGLNRYDGYEFRVFTNDPNDPWSISGNSIDKIFEDSSGRIWAASKNNGINIYDKTTNRFYHLKHDSNTPTGLTGNNIYEMEEDSSGYFVVSVDQKELNMFRLEKEFFSHQIEPNVIRIPMPAEEITSFDSLNSESYRFVKLKGMVKDSLGRIWISGLRTINQLNVSKAEVLPVLKGYAFQHEYADSQGSIWFVENNTHLVKWDGNKAIEFPAIIPNAYEGFRDISLLNDSIFYGYTGENVYSLNIKQAERDLALKISSQQAKGLKWVRAAPKGAIKREMKSWLFGNSGIVWIGTNGYGIHKFEINKGLFSNGLIGSSIKRIYDYNDEIYLKNHEDLLFTTDSTVVSDWGLPIAPWTSGHGGELMPSRNDSTWYRDAGHIIEGQKIYFGDRTEKEFFFLRKYDADFNDYKEYYYSWHHVDSQPIIESKDGSVWMAGYQNVLSHLDVPSGDYTSYNYKNGKIVKTPLDEQRDFTGDKSTALYEDRDGVLWIGSESGFTKFIKPQKNDQTVELTTYENIPGSQNSLSYNHVMCFLDDPIQPDKYLWVCTKGGGLNRLDKESNTFRQLTKENGLPDMVIYCILADTDGNVWGSTNKGIFCMSQEADKNEIGGIKYSFRNFHKAHGLQDNEFNTGAYSKISDDRLAFGGINGYTIFDPKKVLTEAYEPPVFITGLSVNNKPINAGDQSGLLEKTIENTEKVTLNYSDNILTLHFASLDYSAPDRNLYRYQLVGAGENWVEAGSNRTATFLNLEPREYTFRVQGSNSQGVWNERIAELQINILPPWWQTWWAYSLYFIGIIFGVLSSIRFSLKRSKLQQQLEYEKLETERVKDLDALKTQLYMNMTHEFRTPLTIILGMAKQVQDDPKEHFSSGLKMIINNGQNLLGLINKMLNLSKLESGKMTLSPVHGDIILFLRNIVESFHSYAAKKEIQLHFLPEIDSIQMDFDADKLQQIVANLISNAFKFTPEGGHIYFNLRMEDDSFVIRVKDTGRGIPQEDSEKIFDRFYQVDNSTTRQFDGSGIGLALCKDLVTLMEGTISVQSPPRGLKKGSEFMVVLPIRKVANVKIMESSKLHFKKPSLLNIEFDHAPTNAKIENIASDHELPNTKNNEANKPSKPLILLVEDNEDVAAYVASCLPDDYQLAIAVNGQEGLELSVELIPDLVISDVMMPIMDGFEFCKSLKSDNRIDHIPVIILTARADIDSKIEGLEYGANAYLPKPFEKQELLLTIKNLFDHREKSRQYYRSISALGSNTPIEEVISNQTQTEDVFVIKVRKFIEGNIDDFDLSVDQLAKELHLSHSQLGRKLDALTGFSPNRFIRFIRLKNAKELLQNEDLSITVVAYDSGFSDPSYFTRVFKKEFGCTPIQWRSQYFMKQS